MRFERLTSSCDEMFLPAMDLYWSSFPLSEQREYQSQCSIMDEREYHFELIYENDEFVGFVLYWDRGDLIYVEHFCILPERRGGGLGAKALEVLKAAGKPVILEIDPPVNEISRRREAFYARCGFAVNDFDHLHPSYHAMFPGNPLVLMSWPEELSEAEYKDFYAYLRDTVMAQ